VWEWLHSMWILWTLTFGFLNWIAFAFIGIRARQPKWLLAAVFYAAPIGLAFIFEPFVSDSWFNAFVAAMLGLSVVSLVHAFLVRKEYLLRLDLIGGYAARCPRSHTPDDRGSHGEARYRTRRGPYSE
jgi:hypothetical protein